MPDAPRHCARRSAPCRSCATGRTPRSSAGAASASDCSRRFPSRCAPRTSRSPGPRGRHAVDHAVRLHLQRPVEVVLAGGEGSEVIGTVLRRGAVGLHAAPRNSVGIVRPGSDNVLFEQHVLQRCAPAGFAVGSRAGCAHQAGHVDRGGGQHGVGASRMRKPFSSRYSVMPSRRPRAWPGSLGGQRPARRRCRRLRTRRRCAWARQSWRGRQGRPPAKGNREKGGKGGTTAKA